MTAPANSGLAAYTAQTALQFKSVKPLRTGAAPVEKKAEVKNVAKQMETLFMGQLLKEMKKSLPGGGFLPKGAGGDFLEPLVDHALIDGLVRQCSGLERAFERMTRADRQKPGNEALGPAYGPIRVVSATG